VVKRRTDEGDLTRARRGDSELAALTAGGEVGGMIRAVDSSDDVNGYRKERSAGRLLTRTMMPAVEKGRHGMKRERWTEIVCCRHTRRPSDYEWLETWATFYPFSYKLGRSRVMRHHAGTAQPRNNGVEKRLPAVRIRLFDWQLVRWSVAAQRTPSVAQITRTPTPSPPGFSAPASSPAKTILPGIS